MCVVSTEGMKLGWKSVLSVQPGLTLVMTIIPGFVKALCRLVPTNLKLLKSPKLLSWESAPGGCEDRIRKPLAVLSSILCPKTSFQHLTSFLC